MELPVLKIDGSESGKKVVLDEKVFGVEPNDHAIYLDVVQYLANQRQGTAKTKDRSENAHSTKKLGRQKGGGTARHGDRRAPVFIGGGKAHGARRREFDVSLNKKVRALGLKMALSSKVKDGSLIILDNLDEAIRIIRESKTPEEARTNLMERFGLSDIQSRAIVEMRLAQLTKLRQDELRSKYDDLMKRIEDLKDILARVERRMERWSSRREHG